MLNENAQVHSWIFGDVERKITNQKRPSPWKRREKMLNEFMFVCIKQDQEMCGTFLGYKYCQQKFTRIKWLDSRFESFQVAHWIELKLLLRGAKQPKENDSM